MNLANRLLNQDSLGCGPGGRHPSGPHELQGGLQGPSHYLGHHGERHPFTQGGPWLPVLSSATLALYPLHRVSLQLEGQRGALLA